jgi:hypothetical protein
MASALVGQSLADVTNRGALTERPLLPRLALLLDSWPDVIELRRIPDTTKPGDSRLLTGASPGCVTVPGPLKGCDCLVVGVR